MLFATYIGTLVVQIAFVSPRRYAPSDDLGRFKVRKGCLPPLHSAVNKLRSEQSRPINRLLAAEGERGQAPT